MVCAMADELLTYRFRKDPQVGATGMRISCNHDDFTLVSEEDDFEIEIVYNRPIEGEQARSRGSIYR